MSAPASAAPARGRLFMFAVLAAAIAFVIGFGWQYTRAQRLAGELTTTQESLAQAQLDAGLANTLIEAQLGNAEIARQHASKFFGGLQRRVNSLGSEAPAEFRRVLQQRDAAITFLSRSDPESVAMLQRLYADFQAGMRHGAPTR